MVNILFLIKKSKISVNLLQFCLLLERLALSKIPATLSSIMGQILIYPLRIKESVAMILKYAEF